MIIFLTYLHTRLTLIIVGNLSSLININSSFLGITLLSLSGNVGDTINASIAAKLNAPDILTSSILGSQVINLQLCLGLPWMIYILKNYFTNKPPIIYFGFKNQNPLKFCLPLFLVVMASIFILTVCNLNLNKKNGICLIFIYVCYLIYEFDHNLKSK